MHRKKNSFSYRMDRFWAALMDVFGPKKIAVLSVILMTVFLVAVLLITSSCTAPDSPDGKPEDTPEPSSEIVISAVTGKVLPDNDAELLAQAKLLSDMYDYDKAVALVEEYEAAYPGTDFSVFKSEANALKGQTARWEDTTHIPHIFFHSLVADPSRAFDGDEDQDGYNLYMTTVDEFKEIMEQMYARGYVLVDIHDMIKQESAASPYRQGDIYLPAGKMPFVLSVDDVNYYKYMTDGDGDGYPDEKGDGFAHKLVIGSDGRVTNEYYEKDGSLVTGSYDVLPLLEDFVAQHPDFSYRGAKGILGVTGYEGVFGYHTHPDWKETLSSAEYEKEVAEAKAVSEAIKAQGWVIASHSYAHFGYGSCTDDKLLTDVQKWEDQIQPIVGDTDVLLYPFGQDIAGVEDYSGFKYQTLYDAGFRIYCNVDASQDYWVQIHDGYMRQGRINLDGYRLYHSPGLIDHLIDATTVIDPQRPLPVPSL